MRAVHRHTTDRGARNGCLSDACACAFGVDHRAPLPDGVALTSIYARGRGRQVAVMRRARRRDVEVTGSHVGPAFNRVAYRAIAAALARTPDGPSR